MEPLLEVLVGQALERALAEALEERELAALRARQAAYQQARTGWRSSWNRAVILADIVAVSLAGQLWLSDWLAY